MELVGELLFFFLVQWFCCFVTKNLKKFTIKNGKLCTKLILFMTRNFCPCLICWSEPLYKICCVLNSLSSAKIGFEFKRPNNRHQNFDFKSHFAGPPNEFFNKTDGLKQNKEMIENILECSNCRWKLTLKSSKTPSQTHSIDHFNRENVKTILENRQGHKTIIIRNLIKTFFFQDKISIQLQNLSLIATPIISLVKKCITSNKSLSVKCRILKRQMIFFQCVPIKV